MRRYRSLWVGIACAVAALLAVAFHFDVAFVVLSAVLVGAIGSELAEQYGDAHVQIRLRDDDGGVTLRAGHDDPETLGFLPTISIPLEARDQAGRDRAASS